MDPPIEGFEAQLIFRRFGFDVERGMVIAKVTL
jgi:hypothetical protein